MSWVEVDGAGWSLVEVDGPGWRWVRGLVIPDLICWVDLFQNFRFKFDIAWFVLQSLAQKEVLNLLHTYVVVLTLGIHNPCNRRYLLHISLCLSITQTIALKLGTNSPHHKKVPCRYTILFADVPTFPDIMKFF